MRAPTRTLVLLSMLVLGCDNKPKVDPAEAEAKLQADLKSAAAWTRNNKPKDAEKLYNEILQAHPDQPQALAGLAKLRLQDDKLDEALSLADKSIAAKADDATVHALRGDVLARKGDHAAAAAAYGKAFELAPDKSEYGLPHGVQLKLAKKYDEAETVLRKVAELDPMAQFVYTELGDVMRAQNRLDDSLKTYMKALSMWASDKMAHAGAAQVYEAKGDLSHALDEWSTYVRMDCCSPYSTDVAKKKIVELQAASNAGGGAPPAEPPPAQPG
ncbi:MAG: tetratricopeptide repeat protein [Nannocystaceae bacterium]|nr:tetratricopeptide repeat protein [Nannocystaceae bacterium]